MGKARILSAQGEGLYSIEILEDRARAESLKQRALQRIDEIDSELSGLESELDQARQAVDAAAESQEQAIQQHQAEILATGESSVDLQAPAQEVLEAAAARDAIRTRIGSLNLERLQQQGWIDRVDALPPLRTQDAWCADYTEDLSGEVATAEVPGEAKQVIIKPGFEGANQWSASEDGAMQPALASTPAGVFYNLAMMPGWQKWRPTFRVATISNINEDLCDITLDAATSSQQGLNVNAQGSYSGVPIYYMDCNGAAFEEGDRVLVAFSGNTEQPMVVGFESGPKECDSNIVVVFEIDVLMGISSLPSSLGLVPDRWSTAGLLTTSLIPWHVRNYRLRSSKASAYNAKNVLPFEELNYPILAESYGGGVADIGWFESDEFNIMDQADGSKFVSAADNYSNNPSEGITGRCPIINEPVLENAFVSGGDAVVRDMYPQPLPIQNPLAFEMSVSSNEVSVTSKYRTSDPDMYHVLVQPNEWQVTLSARPYATAESAGLQFSINISDLPPYLMGGKAMHPKKFEGAKDVGGKPTSEQVSAAFEGRILIAVSYE